jgi:RNA polymerase sigma-70 factor, ECF subfamily
MAKLALVHDASRGELTPVVAVRGTSRASPESDLAELVRGLREGLSWAERVLLADYTGAVRRVLARILGPTSDLDDLVQEVFIRVVDKVADLREPAAFRGFVTGVAVFVAREAIRKRRRRRWLTFFAPEDLPEPAAANETESVEALKAVYAILDTLAEDLRIPFALRFLEGMPLLDVALATGCSLSTAKRRVAEAETLFRLRATAHPSLVPWLGDRK